MIIRQLYLQSSETGIRYRGRSLDLRRWLCLFFPNTPEAVGTALAAGPFEGGQGSLAEAVGPVETEPTYPMA